MRIDQFPFAGNAIQILGFVAVLVGATILIAALGPASSAVPMTASTISAYCAWRMAAPHDRCGHDDPAPGRGRA